MKSYYQGFGDVGMQLPILKVFHYLEVGEGDIAVGDKIFALYQKSDVISINEFMQSCVR